MNCEIEFKMIGIKDISKIERRDKVKDSAFGEECVVDRIQDIADQYSKAVMNKVGWLYDSLERTREIARATAEVTHNHPEGVKGAESVASAIFMARTGSSKEEIKAYVKDNFHYNLSRTCDEIRPT